MRTSSIFLKILALLLITKCLWSQNLASYYGYLVNNERLPIEFALTMLLKAEDSIIVSSSQSNNLGYFEIKINRKHENKDMILRVSHLNYFEKDITSFQNGDTILLEEKNFQIDKIIVIGDPKEIRKKDTITYNLKYFKDSTEQNLEELISKLPGMTVDRSTGEIKVDNRSIKTILLEGDDVSESNYKTISKNMPAQASSKIQVFYNYESHERDDEVPDIAINVVLDSAYQNRIYGTLQGGLGLQNLHNHNADVFYVSKDFKSIAYVGYNNIGDLNSQYRDIENLSSENYYFPTWFNTISMSDGPTLKLSNRDLTSFDDALIVNSAKLASQLQTQYKWGENNKLYFTVGWSKDNRFANSVLEFDDRVLELKANLEDSVFTQPTLFNSRLRLFSELGRGVKMNVVFLRKLEHSTGNRDRYSSDFISYDFENINRFSENLAQVKLFKSLGKKSSVAVNTFGYCRTTSDKSSSEIHPGSNIFASHYSRFEQNLLLSAQSYSTSASYNYKVKSDKLMVELGYVHFSPHVSSLIKLENRNTLFVEQSSADTLLYFDYVVGKLSYERLHNDNPIFSLISNVFYNQKLSPKVLANIVLGWNHKFSGYNYIRGGINYGFNLPTYQTISQGRVAKDVNNYIQYSQNILPDYSFSGYLSLNGNFKKTNVVYDANLYMLKRLKAYFSDYREAIYGIVNQDIFPQDNLRTQYVGSLTLSNYFQYLSSSISIAPYAGYSKAPLSLSANELQIGALNRGINFVFKTVFDIPVNFNTGLNHNVTRYIFTEFGSAKQLDLFADISLKWKKQIVNIMMDYYVTSSLRENIAANSTAFIVNLSYRCKIRNKVNFNINLNNLYNVPTFVENLSDSLVFQSYSYNLLPRRLWFELGYNF